MDDWYATNREQGYRYATTTPEGLQPDAVRDELPDVEFREAVITPGYRTWVFRTQGDCADFRRAYGVNGI